MKPNNFPVRVTLDGSEEIYTQTGGVAEKFLLDDVKDYIADAAIIDYDNLVSGLSATTVQDAIDELSIGVDNSSTIIYTLELIDYLTVSFYAPFDIKINSITNLVNAPFVSIEDDGAAYSLTNTILAGSKVTVTVNTAAVINLNITKA